MFNFTRDCQILLKSFVLFLVFTNSVCVQLFCDHSVKTCDKSPHASLQSLTLHMKRYVIVSICLSLIAVKNVKNLFGYLFLFLPVCSFGKQIDSYLGQLMWMKRHRRKQLDLMKKSGILPWVHTEKYTHSQYKTSVCTLRRTYLF